MIHVGWKFSLRRYLSAALKSAVNTTEVCRNNYSYLYEYIFQCKFEFFVEVLVLVIATVKKKGSRKY